MSKSVKSPIARSRKRKKRKISLQSQKCDESQKSVSDIWVFLLLFELKRLHYKSCSKRHFEVKKLIKK